MGFSSVPNNIPLIILVLTMTAVGFGMLVYLKKRNK
jgi:hypothetical protein